MFAGAGGGILADILLGHRTVGAVEIEEYPRRVLIERQLDGSLPQFPIWDDVRTFSHENPDTRSYIDWLCERRDTLVIAAGFPCTILASPENVQALARKQEAVSTVKSCDALASFDRVTCSWKTLRRLSQPQTSSLLPFLKSVSSSIFLARRIRSRSQGDTFVASSKLDYKQLSEQFLGTWPRSGMTRNGCVYEPSDCGAPHRRDRWWCLGIQGRSSDKAESFCANSDGIGPHRTSIDQQGKIESTNEQICIARQMGAILADSMRGRCGQSIQQVSQRRSSVETDAGGDGEIQYVADANQHARHEGRPGNATQEPRGRHVDRGGERAGIPDAILDRTGGRKTESGMGGLADVLAAGPLENQWWQVEPDVGRVTDDGKNRVAALKALGNGQSPIQAALAWRLLGGRK